MTAQLFQLSEYQLDRAQEIMKKAVREVAFRQGYAIGHYDGVRAWVWATAPLLAVSFGGGIVFAIFVVAWLP